MIRGKGPVASPVAASETATVSMEALKGVPGSYAVVLVLPEDRSLAVGRLGTIRFPRGGYVYCGSARGPGGLAARLTHHCRPARNPHWHLDHLRPHCELQALWGASGSTVSEHDWARVVADLPGAGMPAAGFGASDCRCSAHLFHFNVPPSFREVSRRLGGGIQQVLDWVEAA